VHTTIKHTTTDNKLTHWVAEHAESGWTR